MAQKQQQQHCRLPFRLNRPPLHLTTSVPPSPTYIQFAIRRHPPTAWPAIYNNNVLTHCIQIQIHSLCAHTHTQTHARMHSQHNAQLSLPDCARC